MVTFPTRSNRCAALGTPTRATGCRCIEGPLTDQPDECLRCGRYLPLVIRRTWRDRAQVIAKRAERIGRAA